jgi:acetyltransferase
MPDATYRIHRYPTHLIECLVLADGRRVTMRPVLPQDDAMEQDFVARLSPASRRMRFHGCVRGLAAAQAARMVSVDYRRELALVVTALEPDPACTDDADGEQGTREVLVADARYVRSADGRTAEFAIVVADDWVGLGLARRLMAALCEGARRGGVQWLRGEVLADNQRMRGLMLACGFSLHPHRQDDGLVMAERSVCGPHGLRVAGRGSRAVLAACRDWLRSLRWLWSNPAVTAR